MSGIFGGLRQDSGSGIWFGLDLGIEFQHDGVCRSASLTSNTASAGMLANQIITAMPIDGEPREGSFNTGPSSAKLVGHYFQD
jgi:hypothetical protein